MKVTNLVLLESQDSIQKLPTVATSVQIAFLLYEHAKYYVKSIIFNILPWL